MNNKLMMILAVAALSCAAICGCGKSEQKQDAEKASQMSKYQEMAAQRGMSRAGGAGGGAATPGQAAPGVPAGN